MFPALHTGLNGCGTAESKVGYKVFESSSSLSKWKHQNITKFQTITQAGQMATHLTNQKTWQIKLMQ
jgi:hypothetical protein